MITSAQEAPEDPAGEHFGRLLSFHRARPTVLRLMFVSNDETDQRSEAERAAVSEKIGAWWTEHSQAGRILNGEQLQGAETATTVRHDHGSVSIVDGPFIEAKEEIGGYGVIDVP